ncbi:MULTISPECIES: UvrD-helicase domain-containing protein, partial [Pseudonocardia]
MGGRETEWAPVGIPSLEPAALEAVREAGHGCVIAGPGAGKTELLAQKAAYLFSSGLCPAPYRVLSISFKTDSAENLARRVEERCGRATSLRFDSMTFDAFTKNILDRFSTTLPQIWQPSNAYHVDFPTRGDFRTFTAKLAQFRPHWRDVLMGMTWDDFSQNLLGTFSLPSSPAAAATAQECAVLNWVKSGVDRSPSALSFPVINRLTHLLLRNAPSVARALMATYPFVFVDEFQDTTHSQYDLLASTFLSGGSKITVVGDEKQKIMGWAGARSDSFGAFCSEVSISPRELRFNYRSVPDLVRVQHSVAQQLDPAIEMGESKAELIEDEQSARLWTFDRIDDEGERIARWIKEDHLRTGLPYDNYV